MYPFMATVLKKSGVLTALVDPFQPTKEHADRSVRIDPDTRAWGVPLLIGVAFLVMSFVGWAVVEDASQFYFSYLVGWFFCLTLTLGALFFVLIHHITRAYWSVVVRRIAEAIMWSFPLLAVLSIPILIGMHDLYHWTHTDLLIPGEPEFDPIIYGKRGYLNTGFFVARLALYFVIWIIMSYKLYRYSLLQDVTADPELPAKMRKVSAWGIPVFAVTTAFSSYDLIMSLDPHWFSTIFGVYIFSGAFWSSIALITLTAAALQRVGGSLQHIVTDEHYQDLGKWMFAFTVFWTYIAFSQYMLIWYANIPEETIWYHHRLDHGWGYHSAALLIAHFILPFVLLLPRFVKRIPAFLSVMGIWFLIMQWFDLHWLSMPVLHEHGGFHWLDLTCWIGLFSLYLGIFIYRLSRHSLTPQSDPYLARSVRFQNV